MPDRKAALERLLKLQNQQLEEWERDRLTYQNAGEKDRCDRKIADIKILLKQTQDELDELNNIKGPKRRKRTIAASTAGKETTTNPVLPAIPGKHNDKLPPAPTGNNILLPGDWFFFLLFVLFAIVILVLGLTSEVSKKAVSPTAQWLIFSVTLLGIAGIYLYTTLNQGLKLALAVIILCVDAGIILKNFEILGERVGKGIVIPLIIAVIASIFSLIGNGKRHGANN